MTTVYHDGDRRTGSRPGRSRTRADLARRWRIARGRLRRGPDPHVGRVRRRARTRDLRYGAPRVRLRLGTAARCRPPGSPANHSRGPGSPPSPWRRSESCCWSHDRAMGRSTPPAGCGPPPRSRSPGGWSCSCDAASTAEFDGCSTRSWQRSSSDPSAERYETVARARDSTTTRRPVSCTTSAATGCTSIASDRAAPPSCSQNGLGGVSVLWSRITEPVARTTRVCAYDRAGQGWSDDVDAPQDGEEIAEDLHTLLERAGETSPFVLVGHSAGGVYSMIYADRYPDEVAGMVLLDSMTPYQFTALPDFGSEYSMMRRGLAVLPSIARLGVARALPAAAFSSVPEPAASQVRAFAADPRQFRNMRDEHSGLPRRSRTGQGAHQPRRQAARRHHSERATTQVQRVGGSSGSARRALDRQRAPRRRNDPRGRHRRRTRLRAVRSGDRRRRLLGPNRCPDRPPLTVGAGRGRAEDAIGLLGSNRVGKSTIRTALDSRPDVRADAGRGPSVATDASNCSRRLPRGWRLRRSRGRCRW